METSVRENIVWICQMLALLQTLCTVNWICILPIILSMNYFSNFIFFLLYNISLFQK